MTKKLMIALAAVLFAAGCEPDKGAGFTGIGTSQSAVSAYDLSFPGLAFVAEKTAQEMAKAAN